MYLNVSMGATPDKIPHGSIVVKHEESLVGPLDQIAHKENAKAETKVRAESETAAAETLAPSEHGEEEEQEESTAQGQM